MKMSDERGVIDRPEETEIRIRDEWGRGMRKDLEDKRRMKRVGVIYGNGKER
jgi:hypothetical protein